MKSLMKCLLLLGGVSLSACSSNMALSDKTMVDQKYVQQVEAASRNSTHHLRVYWVNPPVKKSRQVEEPDS